MTAVLLKVYNININTLYCLQKNAFGTKYKLDKDMIDTCYSCNNYYSMLSKYCFHLEYYLYWVIVEDFKKFCSILSCSNCTIINNIFLQAIYHILRYKQTVSGLEQHSSFIRKWPLEVYKFLTQSTCTRYSHQLWAPSTDNGNSGLKFPKFHVQNGLVPLQNLNPKIAYIPAAQTRPKPMCIILVIVLVSRIQKSSTEDINFVK